MKFLQITLKDGFFKKTVQFSLNTNEIYSQKNSVGKTTFLRAIFYALGYPIPSTKGIKFDDMEFWLSVENDNKLYKLYRHNSYLSVDDGGKHLDYSLPFDLYEIQTLLTGCNNKDVLNNLLGASYMDQEKGWTLLNRGKVIGNISFNVEELVRGLAERNCDQDILKLEAVKKSLEKYKYMLSVKEYQEKMYEAGYDIEYDAPEEVRDLRIDSLNIRKEQINGEFNQIKEILRKNNQFAEYITDFKLRVQGDDGKEIPVTRKTLVGFEDNVNFLIARRNLLAAELKEITSQIISLNNQKEKEDVLFKVQTTIEAFDSEIKKIYVDAISTKKIIDELEKERKELKERIRSITKHDNSVIIELLNCISTYAKELDVSDTYVIQSEDYIFTKDLQSLSGAILHKIVFSFKLAYIKAIRERTGIILPIVLDSPSGKEVKHETVENMLRIIQRDFSDHQLFVASIYEYDLQGDKKRIEFKNGLFELSDFISEDEQLN